MGRMGSRVFASMASGDSHPLDKEHDGLGEWISHEAVQGLLSRSDPTSTFCSTYHSPSVDIQSQFISIHVRHGDFGTQCRDVPVLECFAPLSVIDRRVQEVQAELQRKFPGIGGGQPIPVLMTSDERDPAWWEDVRRLGWYFVDHGPEAENTAGKYGKWYVHLTCPHNYRSCNVGGLYSSIPCFSRWGKVSLGRLPRPCRSWRVGGWRTGKMERHGCSTGDGLVLTTIDDYTSRCRVWTPVCPLCTFESGFGVLFCTFSS